MPLTLPVAACDPPPPLASEVRRFRRFLSGFPRSIIIRSSFVTEYSYVIALATLRRPPRLIRVLKIASLSRALKQSRRGGEQRVTSLPFPVVPFRHEETAELSAADHTRVAQLADTVSESTLKIVPPRR